MIWIIASPLLCLGVCLPMFMYYKSAAKYSLAAMYKSAGTLCALIPALVAAIRLDPHCWICAAGILLCAVGDYLLEFSTLLGGGFFLAGHICYIAFLIHLFPVSAVHVICLAVFLGILVFTFYKNKTLIGKQLPVFAVYGVVLSVMAAFAVGALASGTTYGILIACAGALFFVSDYILLHRNLYTAGKAVSWIIMITYYTAQLLFGISCLYI